MGDNEKSEIRWGQRNDLCNDNMIACYYAPDYGTLVHRPEGWWASNDTRLRLIGIKPGTELTQPTLGPFPSRRAAQAAYETASSGEK